VLQVHLAGLGRQHRQRRVVGALHVGARGDGLAGQCTSRLLRALCSTWARRIGAGGLPAGWAKAAATLAQASAAARVICLMLMVELMPEVPDRNLTRT
jgi:hypothetical protein